MLRDSGVVHARREEKWNTKLAAGLDVDLVDADAVFGKDFQLWQGFLEHFASDEVITTDVAVDVAHECEGVGLVERAASSDDFPAGVGKKFMMLAGSVLERGRGEEDFSHGSKK